MPTMVQVVQKEMWPAAVRNTAKYNDFLRSELLGVTEAKWWKDIGAILTFNGGILLAAFNSPRVVDLSEYLEGDLRGLELGQCVWSQEAMCPEAIIVGIAASGRTIMKGTDLFVDSFPCLPCARLCARTGIRRLFYRGGRPYSPEVTTFQSEGVEIFQVK